VVVSQELPFEVLDKNCYHIKSNSEVQRRDNGMYNHHHHHHFSWETPIKHRTKS